MIPNVCGRERNIRAMIGVILIVLGMVIANWVLGVVGFALLLTAVFSYCPVNYLLHRNSCTVKERAKDMVNDVVNNSGTVV